MNKVKKNLKFVDNVIFIGFVFILPVYLITIINLLYDININLNIIFMLIYLMVVTFPLIIERVKK